MRKWCKIPEQAAEWAHGGSIFSDFTSRAHLFSSSSAVGDLHVFLSVFSFIFEEAGREEQGQAVLPLPEERSRQERLQEPPA